MTEQKKDRTIYDTPSYHVERSKEGQDYHPQTPWQLNVHINPEDMKAAYDVLSPYAEEKDLTVYFAARKVREEYNNENIDSPPMVVVRHSNSLDDPQEILTEIEHMLDRAEVRPGKAEDFTGKPVRGSKYMDATLYQAEKYTGEYPDKVPPENPFATVEIRKNYTQQTELEFDAPEQSEQEL